MAGIFGGLQSLHADSYDEAIACPTEGPARVAVATQNILREEAHLCDVIDPLGGSYYVEALTNKMEQKIIDVIETIDGVGGMYAAVESGLVQRMIGKSALEHQSRIEEGEQKVVGVNCYQYDDDGAEPEAYRPNRAEMERHVAAFKAFKSERDQMAVRRALDALARAASGSENAFAQVVEAAKPV